MKRTKHTNGFLELRSKVWHILIEPGGRDGVITCSPAFLVARQAYLQCGVRFLVPDAWH